VLDSKLSSRIYINGLTAGEQSDDGEYTAIKGKDGKACFEIHHINPAKLEEFHSITYKGKTYSFSAVSYCSRALNSADPKTVALAKAAYDKGSKDLDDFEAMFNDENAKSDDLLAKATSAYASFKSVLVALYKDIAKDARADALEAKKDADSVKAGVSEKREYTRAVELFKKGDASYSMNGYEAACDAYDEAYDIFSTLYETISEKRAAALAAIEAAKKSVEESAAVAEEADLEAPLTSAVDGIEDEDAVLLDEDNYANPEDSEAYLDEDISISFGGDAK
jgi:hypothetical protein